MLRVWCLASYSRPRGPARRLNRLEHYSRTGLGRVHEGHTRFVLISFRFAAPALQVGLM